MKKIICLFLILILAFSFVGCSVGMLEINYDKDTQPFGDTNSKEYSEQTSDIETPTFYGLKELSEYLNQQKDNNVFDVSFYYKGTEELQSQMLAQMVSCFYIVYEQGDEETLHSVEITEYPGDRIVDAYFNRNNVTLNSDEQKALNKAQEMLASIKSKTSDRWEIELAIHDTLAEHITYYDEPADIIDPQSPPRFLTAIGALLDGKANCQGYTDAFYLLASLAGFEVSRMNVESAEGLHIVNTILLNGSWYVVDVTFDDQENGAKTSYRLFNAGLDQTGELFWEPYKEIHKIAAASGYDSYYIRKGISFNDPHTLADYLTNKWLEGENTLRCMLRNQTDINKLKTPFEKSLEKTGRGYNYTISYHQDGVNLYCTIEIE